MSGTPEHAIAQRVLIERAWLYVRTDQRLVWTMLRSARALGPMSDELETKAAEVENEADRVWMQGPAPTRLPRDRAA